MRIGGSVASAYGVSGNSITLLQTVTPAEVQTSDRDLYGSHLAIADVTGDGNADVLTSVMNWRVGGLTDAGAVFVHKGTGISGTPLQVAPIILTAPSPQAGDNFGAHVASGDLDGAPGGHLDLLAMDYWTAGETTADVFPGPILASGQTPVPALRLIPRGGLTRGWATRGAAVADVNGDGLDDVVVGAPNTPDNATCNSMGTTYVFLAQGSMATGTTGWQRYSMQAPSVDTDFGGYGWSTAAESGSPLVLIGEHGRNVGSVQMAGQVYIYRVLP